MKKFTLDVECYWNYFLLTIMDYPSGNVIGEFEMYNNIRYPTHSPDDILRIIRSGTNITFNGNRYDMMMVTAYLAGYDNVSLKQLNNRIIDHNLMPWIFEREYGLKIIDCDHIDLIEVAFGSASLKLYGARLHSHRLQELPIHHNNVIMPSQCKTLRMYCRNDNFVTQDLMSELEVAIDTRSTMTIRNDRGLVDVRSKSDAQVGESYIVNGCALRGVILRKPDKKLIPKSFKYVKPDFITFQTPALDRLVAKMESIDFKLSDKYSLIFPKELDVIRFYSDNDKAQAIENELEMCYAVDSTEYTLAAINKNIKEATARGDSDNVDFFTGLKLLRKQIRDLKNELQKLVVRQYSIGMGGIHSQFDTGTHVAVKGLRLLEIDVSSYYPWIIILAKLHPKQIPLHIWQELYQELVDVKINLTARNKVIENRLSDIDRELSELGYNG